MSSRVGNKTIHLNGKLFGTHKSLQINNHIIFALWYGTFISNSAKCRPMYELFIFLPWHIVGTIYHLIDDQAPNQPQFSYRQLSVRITICVPERNGLNRERPGDRPVCSPRQKGRAIARYRVSVYTTWAGALPCQQLPQAPTGSCKLANARNAAGKDGWVESQPATTRPPVGPHTRHSRDKKERWLAPQKIRGKTCTDCVCIRLLNDQCFSLITSFWHTFSVRIGWVYIQQLLRLRKHRKAKTSMSNYYWTVFIPEKENKIQRLTW